MTPGGLAQLIASGNASVMEQEWMGLVTNPDATPAALAPYAEVLSALVEGGKQATAAELAWAALEELTARHEPIDVLEAARPFLLAVGESDELRRQVVDLYRSAYADHDGLEGLLEHAGLGGGRPVRRALRTLEVCLSASEGDYLVARDEDEAARIDRIDTGEWLFTVTEPGGREEYEAVHLADRYRRGSPTEFSVMRQFAPAQLSERMQSDPAAIVIDICREHGGQIDSGVLEERLVPGVLSEAEWKKWWPKARTSLKRHPNVTMEGRSPYKIRYVESPVALEDGVLEEFQRRQHEPQRQIEVIEGYLRECKVCHVEPSEPLLCRCMEAFRERARNAAAEGSDLSGLYWVLARRLAESSGIEPSPSEGLAVFRDADDPAVLLAPITDETLAEVACAYLIEARPDDWTEEMLTLLPALPAGVCDKMAHRLLEARKTTEDMEPVIQQIMSSPRQHFEALLWLWDGPSDEEQLPMPTPITVLMKLLRTLEESRVDDGVDKETMKRMAQRARSVLAARKYERFRACLKGIDASMASALRNQLRGQELLGRTVPGEMLSRLNRAFPPVAKQPALAPWERDDVLYVTEEGLSRKQAEIEHHVNVKMKQNAEAIGRAAEHGDLSENSEYKFALEERDLLRSRLGQMNAEVAAARVISPADVPTDHIGIGSRARFRNVDNGDDYEMTIVGPWEADTEKGKINYKAPLAQKLLGKKIGEIVEFDHGGAVGRYELVAVENSLAVQQEASP